MEGLVIMDDNEQNYDGVTAWAIRAVTKGLANDQNAFVMIRCFTGKGITMVQLVVKRSL